jgi:hypothetical protein
MYQVELIWNREFHWASFGETVENINDAIDYARALEYMGDGESVKKTRIINLETNEIIESYQYEKKRNIRI